MESLPRKQTLPELVIARLREGITEGEWEGALPAERALSEKLEVSRSTLRLGISQLKDEGWLKVVGKRTMIVKRRKRTRANRGDEEATHRVPLPDPPGATATDGALRLR